MPSQQEVQWSQLKVGVLVLVAIAVLVALIFLMSGSTGGIFTGKLTARSYFENSSGIKVGAPVNLEGVTIGNVKAIRIVPDRKLTPVEGNDGGVSKKYATGLHTDSRASLVTIGVLGDTVLEISSTNAHGPELQENAELQTTETPDLSDVIKSSQGTIEQLNTILAKVDSLVDALNTGKGSIGKLIQDPELYNRANDAVTQIQKLVSEVGSGKGTIGKLIVDDTLYNRAEEAVGRIQHIADDLDNGKGTAGKILKDETLYNNLNKTVAGARQLLDDINAGRGGLGMLAKDPAFRQKLDDTITKLDSLLTRADSGEGTIGQLVRNPSVYNNADQMLTETRRLVAAIREDPKKYLTFHVKIF